MGGLLNPNKRNKVSTVFYGAELAYQSIGRDVDFVSNAIDKF